MENSRTQPPPVSVLHEILTWSTERPGWQRDALRRIITKEKLDHSDRLELENLCRNGSEAISASGQPLTAIPLSEEHLPPAPSSQIGVSLEKLCDISGVNRLQSGATLPFGPSPGVTVIYGDNGTGKSGYVRVIKKACRTRGAPPVIQPDVFSTALPVKASCTIGIKTPNGIESIAWMDGTPADEKLGNVFVFDSAAASHYLQSDSPASFTPYGLDVLPKLAKICDAVAERIRQDINAVEAVIARGKTTLGKHNNTSIGVFLSAIDADTTMEGINYLAALSNDDKRRVTDLQAILNSDPRQKAKETRASKARIDSFTERVTDINKLLSRENISVVKQSFENISKALANVAKSSAEAAFSKDALSGTGSQVWQKMWTAARTYSKELAYPGVKFPQTDAGARCVLCQRPFGTDQAAIVQLMSFEDFCNNEAHKTAREAREAYENATERFANSVLLKPDYDAITADLSIAAQEDVEKLDAFVAESDRRLTGVKDIIAHNEWSDPGAPAEAPVEILERISTNLEMRATTEESADDPLKREALKKEHDELAARVWLESVKIDVEEQIKSLKKVVGLNARLEETRTNEITKKNSALTKSLITDAYRNRFADEISGLGLRTVQVVLEELEGTKGEKSFGIRLVGAPENVHVHDIVSEGEHRCISLAAFLSELSQSSHKSALVFDDPVSSLDHSYRQRLASRLVKEAEIRQVIVFTHDTVFLNDLVSEAKQTSRPFVTHFLEWNNAKPGWPAPGLPWDCKSPEDRLDKLEKDQRALKARWQPIPNEQLKGDMCDAYGRLRGTLERTVERLVFADVIFRFRTYVNMKNLHKVVGFSEAEHTELQRLYKKCSEVTASHDAAAGKQSSVPDPTEFAADIDATKKLVETIRTRSKASTP